MKMCAAEFKSGIIAKMMAPHNISVTHLSKETGLPKDTPYACRLKARGYRERDVSNGAVSKGAFAAKTHSRLSSKQPA
jgi:hypothetical protein